MKTAPSQKGFTLIELSIVLVIIGLIIGGVLVGQDLINAATIRAQVTQIEKYQTAVNTFRGKYNDQLPGDMDANTASMFGFTARTGSTGDGDGNGFLEYNSGSESAAGCPGPNGEPMMFWNDLGFANLVESSFPNDTDADLNVGGNMSQYLPTAKIGNNNYIYVWSTGHGTCAGSLTAGGEENYFSLAQVSGISNGMYTSQQGISVLQAYAIDKKVDDGFPQSGHVMAMYLSWSGIFSSSIAWAEQPTPCTGFCFSVGPASGPAPGSGVAATPSAQTCYDDGGSTVNPMHYSTEESGGTNINCALSFQFQ